MSTQINSRRNKPYIRTTLTLTILVTQNERRFTATKVGSSDIFAVGVLFIEVISQQEPIPTEYIDVRTSVLYTEFQRRQKYIDQFSTEEKEHFIPPIKQCVTATEDDRPRASGLVIRIQQIRSTLGISNKQVTANDLNLSFSSLPSVTSLKAADSFKEIHQFKLANVRQTGVELGGGSFSVVYEVGVESENMCRKAIRSVWTQA